MSEPIQNEKVCQICYLSYIPIDCKSETICVHMINEICKTCLDQWIKELISKTNTANHNLITIPCPIEGCNKSITLMNLLLQLININQLPLTDQQLLDNHLRQSYDIANCPNQTCKYRGFYKKQSCSDPLICEVCKHEWHESSQKGFWSSIKNYKEFKSNIYKYCFTKNCPTCKAPIQKNGGCNNMICKKCNASFCWLCLNLNRKHPLSCGFRVFAKSMVIFSPIVYLFKRFDFFKQAKSYQAIKKCQKWYDYVLYPFKAMGVGLRFACYYSFCISTLFALYSGGVLLQNWIQEIKASIQRRREINIEYKEAQLDQVIKKPQMQRPLPFTIANAKTTLKISLAGLFASGIISSIFGNKQEIKLFVGANILYVSLFASLFVGSSF